MLSRRRFLSLLAAGSACLASPVLPSWADNKRFDVLVLGAGAAGLAAARWLARQDYDVLVLEARPRLGGRVWTNTSLGFPCDLGASWIHEATGNPLTKMCTDFSIGTLVDPDKWLYYNAQGRPQPASLQGRVERLTQKVSESNISGQISIESACQRLIRSGEISSQTPEVLRIFSHGCATENGTSPQDAALDTLRDEGYSGADRLFPGGYRQLIDRWAQGLTVRTGQVVMGVEWGKSGVRVTTNQGVFEGKACVLTLPLGVLQAGNIRFDPPLPAAQAKALSALRMGTLDKVVVRYSASDWPSANHFGFPHQPVGVHGEVANLQSLFGVPALMSFLAGSAAKEREQWSDTALVKELGSTVQPIWGGKRVPNIEGSLVTRWSQDPYSRGSYSYLPPGVEPAARAWLGRPQAPLYFAGEATNEKLPATVHGAYLSGQRAAKELDRDWKD